MSNLKAVFANNLMQYMNQRGVDRNQLCDDLGFKYSTVSEWLSAKKYPRIDKIELLANYFDIQKSNLIERVAEESIILTTQEADLIRAYRAKPELQAAVNKLLLG